MSGGLIIRFDPPVVYNPPRPNPITYETITVNRMVDDPSIKQVIAVTNIGNFILWEDLSYDQIGQWTDNDVSIRLREILNNQNV